MSIEREYQKVYSKLTILETVAHKIELETKQRDLRVRLKELIQNGQENSEEARRIRVSMYLNRRGPLGLRTLTKHPIWPKESDENKLVKI